MLKTGYLAAGGDVHPEFLFLERPEPAVRPAPQPHAASHDLIGFFQAELALEEGLGLVVEAEAGSLPIASGAVSLQAQELLGQDLGLHSAHREINGGLGKGAVEILGREPDGDEQREEADRQETAGAAGGGVRDGGQGSRQGYGSKNKGKRQTAKGKKRGRDRFLETLGTEARVGYALAVGACETLAHRSGNQKVNRSEPCIRLESRVEINAPNRVLLCRPLGSKRVLVSIPKNCVWLKALYISQRNWKRARSFTGKSLNRERSQLL